MIASKTVLNLLHFNDVYRVTKQRVDGGEIDVSQWARMLDERRREWPVRPDGKPDGLLLFSGDAFSPSVESSVTRGSHMVPVMNALKIDCAVAGNHDFDWSAPHFLKLVEASNYPWLLSNIIDTNTGKTPEGLQTSHVLERSGVRIGIIGLVEEEWIQTISSWPKNYRYQDMKGVALRLSRELRDPGGSHKCDLIIALTHSRLPNDIELARSLHARMGSSAVNEHGIDIILGGHDHFYYVSKFSPDACWEGYDVNERVLGAENDDGVLVIKSGTDFRDLSDIRLGIEDSPPGSVRTKYISAVQGVRLTTQPDQEASEEITSILKDVLSHLAKSFSKPICKLDALLDCRSEVVRLGESASGNWFADVIFHAYDDALCLQGQGGADGVLICGGTIRGDSTYGPGELTIGNILEILPFQDPIVVLQLDGPTIWAALESALSTWPAQEGRFPIISGLFVEWDSSRPKGDRVLSIILRRDQQTGNSDSDDGHETPAIVEEPVSKEQGGRTYNIVTRLYMAQGFDGYEALKRGKYLVDEENGRIMSDLVRHFLLGSQYVNRMKYLTAECTPHHLSERTNQIIVSAQRKQANGEARHGKSRWAEIVREKIIQHSASQGRNFFTVAGAEHMSTVDCIDGGKFRGEQGRHASIDEQMRNDIVTVSPRIDGRLKDVARRR